MTSKIHMRNGKYANMLFRGFVIGGFFILALSNILFRGTTQAFVTITLSVPLAFATPILANALFDLWTKRTHTIHARHVMFAFLFLIIATKFVLGLWWQADTLTTALWETLTFAGYILFLIAVVSSITLMSIALGERVVRKLCIQLSATASPPITFAIGQGIIMLVMFLLGVFSLYYTSIAYGLFLCGLLFEWRRISELCMRIWMWGIPTTRITSWLDKLPNRTQRGMVLAMVLFCIISAFVMLFNSLLTHPYATDSLRVYMSVSRASAEMHTLVNYEASTLNYFPKNGEMLYTLGFLLVDHNIANLFILLYVWGALWVLFLLSQLLRKDHESRGPPVFIFYFLLIPSIMIFAYGIGKIDIFMLFYILLATYVAVLMHKEERLIPWALLLGALFGIALGIKYTAIISVVAILFALPLLLKKNVRQTLVVCFFSGMVMMLLFTPWAVRNFILVGNPIAPFFLEQLNSGNTLYDKLGAGSYEKITESNRDTANYELFNQESRDWKYYFALPFRVTANATPLVMRMNDIGPLFLSFAFLLCCVTLYTNRLTRYILGVIALHIVAYLLVIDLTCVWYILPAFPLLLLVYQRALDTRSVGFQTIIMRLILIASLISLFSNVYIHEFSLMHPHSKLEFIARQDHPYIRRFIEIREISRLLSFEEHRSGKVHFLNDGSVYFLDNFPSRVISTTNLDIFGFLFDQGTDHKAMTNKFKELDVAYFLLNKEYARVHQKLIMEASVHSPTISAHYREWNPAFQAYAQEELEPIYEGTVYTLYRFK